MKDGTPIHVLRGVDLEIRAGETVSIMGRSGAGKSTFLQILGTLDRPTAGHVWFEGQDVFAKSEAQLAQFRGGAIGFVFQFHHLLPELTTLENAALPALIARMPRTEAFARARQTLERVGLGARLTHLPGELSGGEQQRVSLARALVMRPRLVLADEPTGNLDDETGRDIVALLHDLVRDAGVAVVVVTHNHALAQSMQRQIVVDEGRLVEQHREPTDRSVA